MLSTTGHSRRHFLRAGCVALALPFLESLAPQVMAADAPETGAAIPRRMVYICQNLGLHMPHWVPKEAGRDYKPSRYLKHIDDLRHDYTVFSGVSHPGVDGAHAAEKSFLTCATHPGSSSFKNSVSVDQFMAERLSGQTRYPSLVLAANGAFGMSWTRAGVPIPPATKPSQVFKKLFLNGTKDEMALQMSRLRMDESIMDMVSAQAKAMNQQLSTIDKMKFDEYQTAVREVEVQMQNRQDWEQKPKPTVKAKAPIDNNDEADVVNRARLMYDLMHLALQTDSTRLMTLSIEGRFAVPPIEGVDAGYHTVSHHSMDPKKIETLGLIEDELVKALGEFLRKLKGSNEQNDTLLNRTMVFFGGDLGNASNHDNRNLPALLAGGGFKHGQHLAFDTEKNYPLANVFVSMLQRMGVETTQFGSSTGTMKGLEFA